MKQSVSGNESDGVQIIDKEGAREESEEMIIHVYTRCMM